MFSKINELNWQEPTAYCAAAASLIFGTILGWSKDFDWLGRAGSLVIVAGVLLAYSRKVELLHKKALAFFESYRSNHPEVVRDELEKHLGRAPTDQEVRTMEAALYAAAESETAVLIDKRRRIFKLHELILVVSGTLVNGFGPWLLRVIKAAI